MNKELLELRKKFKGQTAQVKNGGTFDNSPVPEGTYTMRVVESNCKDTARKGVKMPTHYIMLKVEIGEHKGRHFWPFAPDLSSVDGVIASAQNVRAILGDGVVPGRSDSEGQFNLDMGKYIEDFESIAHRLIGEVVEVKIKNGKTMRDDGTPFQSVYINRGLGADTKATLQRGQGEQETVKKTPIENLNVMRRKKAVAK